MDKIIQIEKHHIEAWGLWWIQWQQQTKEALRKHGTSPQSFVNKHLISSKDEGLLGNTTTRLVLPPK
jgi:hypothetical protein